jgi:hypothetical protein
MKVHPSPDCGNSPKNRFVEEVAAAIVVGDVEFLARHAVEDVRWIRPGRPDLVGTAQLANGSEGRRKGYELRIHHVVSHGKIGAANGEVAGDGWKAAFCHVLVFATAKADRVASITSYVIEE